MCFWLLAFGATVGGTGQLPSGEADNGTFSAGFIGLSLLLAPVAFILASTVSRRVDWPLWVAAGMGLSIAVGLPTLAFGNPLASMITGFAAGAVVTVSEEGDLGWKHRALGAAIVSVVVIIGMRTALFVPLAIIGPALPFTAVGVSDLIVRRRLGGSAAISL